MRRQFLLGSAALLCATLLLATPAIARYDPVAGGTTRISLDQSFAHLLAANGVRIVAKGGARRRDRALVLPASGGRVDPVVERGEVESAGMLVIERGNRQVKVRRIVVKSKPEPLVARVGGGQLKLASAAKLSFERAGFGSLIAARSLRLTAKVATRLNKKLRLRSVFEAGQRLGSLRSEAQPATLAVLPEGPATFTPSPEFLAKLDSRFVSLNPIAPAERMPGPVFTVPLIPEGTISPDAAAGVPRTGGALEFLQLGSGQVFWQELWFDLAAGQLLATVDIEPTPTFPGKVGQVAVATLSQSAVEPDPKARVVRVSGGFALSATGAQQFNLAFGGGKDVFQPGEPLGSLSFSAHTQ
jgi:hypothetical protein